MPKVASVKRQKLTELDGVMVIGVHSITYLVICVTAVSLTEYRVVLY